MPNPSLSVMEGGIVASGWNNIKGDSISKMYFEALSKRYHFKLTEPLKNLSKEAMDAILYGTKGEPLQLRYERQEGYGVIKREFEGIVTNLAATARPRARPCARISRSAWRRWAAPSVTASASKRPPSPSRWAA